MKTHLYIHKEETTTSEEEYRASYTVKQVDYSLSRDASCKGEVTSKLKGGVINIVIDGFVERTLLVWLFDQSKTENGQVLTFDENSKEVSRFYFTQAKIIDFSIDYDLSMKNGLSTLITIEANEIVTDNGLNFQNN